MNWALTPPINTVRGSVTNRKVPSDAAMLLPIGGLTAPRPVHAMINGSREVIEIGADVKLPILVPAGAATAPVLLLYAKAWPIPFAVVVKIPGDAGTIGTVCGAEVPLARRRCL